MIVQIAMAVILTGGVSTYEPLVPADAQNQASTVAAPKQLDCSLIDGKDAARTERNQYIHDVSTNVGCPYQQFASYLSTCKPEKRQQAWKRMVRENWLFCDKPRMKQFEAISRKYAFL